MGTDGELLAEVDVLRARLAELEARLQRTHRGRRIPGSLTTVLFVRVAELLAAFELERVREVLPAALLAPLPESPDWVLGTLNLRGTTLPVVELASRLYGAAEELAVSDVIVVVSTQLGALGVVVNEVGAIKQVRLDEEPSLLEAPHAAYVVATFSHENQARLLLGVEELLRHSELAPLLADSEQGT